LESAGVEVWQDTARIRGGERWSRKIEEGLASCGALIAVLTQGALDSDNCRDEQLWALQAGKLVIPVMTGDGVLPPIYLTSRLWRRYPEQMAELLLDLAADSDAAPRKFHFATIPTPPQNHIPRADLVARLRDLVFAAPEGTNIAVTAVNGMGGIGKTVLAIDLCRDPAVRLTFPDGIAWITVGRESTTDVVARMGEIGLALGCDITSEAQYRARLRDKAALIVIDDVWDLTDVTPLLTETPNSRFLFTTRNVGVAKAASAREFAMELASEEEARDIMKRWAGRLSGVADQIIARCGNLPLAIAVIGAILRAASDEEWQDVLELLRNADISAIEELLPPGQKSFFQSQQVSVSSLTARMRERYLALAVVIEDVPTQLPVLQTLWGVSAGEARRTAKYFADRSLASWDEAIRLHDLQLDYIRANFPDQKALTLIHGAIRLSASAILRDPFQFVSQVVGRLLSHLDNPAIRGFTEQLASAAPSHWLRTLRCSLHPPGTALIRTLHGKGFYVAITPDGQRAASTCDIRTGVDMHGRIVDRESRSTSITIWDLASGRALVSIDSSAHCVSEVALSGDARRALYTTGEEYGSKGHGLRVWNTETGQETDLFEHCYEKPSSVAVSASGRIALSPDSVGWHLCLWDLDAARELRSFGQRWEEERHREAITCVAITPDGQLGLSGSRDSALKLWNLRTGDCLKTIYQRSRVNSVAVTENGQYALSAVEDGLYARSEVKHTVDLWNLETGALVLSLKGHSDVVNRAAMTPDGRRAVSASSDGTLKVWDLETGQETCTLTGHYNPVKDVAISADGHRIISASRDGALKVWNADTTCAAPLWRAHDACVNALAVSEDLKSVVSASSDGTVKLWDLETCTERQTFRGNYGSVYQVGIRSTINRMVSIAEDIRESTKTVVIWDLKSGQALKTYGCMGGVVAGSSGKSSPGGLLWNADGRLLLYGDLGCCAVSADGQRGVSANSETISLWDLKGFSRRIYGRGSLKVEEAPRRAPPKICDLVPRSEGTPVLVAMNPEGTLLLSGYYDGRLTMWDADAGREVCSWQGHSREVSALAVRADGRRAVSAAGDAVAVWDLQPTRLLSSFTCDAGEVTCCALIGDIVVIGDATGVVHFLSLEVPRGLT